MASETTSCFHPRAPLDATPAITGMSEPSRSREMLFPPGDSDYRQEATEEEAGEDLVGGATTNDSFEDVTHQYKLSFPTISSKTRGTKRCKIF